MTNQKPIAHSSSGARSLRLRCALIALFCSSVPLAALLAAHILDDSVEQRPFSSPEWVQAQGQDSIQMGEKRQSMLVDLLERHLRPGDSLEEISALLGEAKYHVRRDNGEIIWQYTLGPGRGFWPRRDFEVLQLDFSPDGILIEHSVP